MSSSPSLPAHPDPSNPCTTPAPSPSRRGRPLLLSNLLDAGGCQGADLAFDVLAVAVLGATAAQMGLLNAIGTLAFLLLGIPIGVMVDRSPRVRLLVGSGLVRAALLGTVVVAWAVDGLTMVHLYAVAALAGVATATAQTAIVPRLVGVAGVSRLVSRMQSAESVVGLVVPALAGAAVALMGAGPALAVAAALVAVAALVVLRVRLVDRGQATGQRVADQADVEPSDVVDAGESSPGGALRGLFREAGQGWRALRGNQALWRLALGAMVINLGLAVHSAVEVVLVLRTLDLGATVLGVLVSAGALGALLGSFIAVPLSTRFGVPGVLRVSVLLLAPVAGLTLIALLDPDRAVVWLMAGTFLWGLTMVVDNVINAGLAAELTPAYLLGRVAATRRTLTMGIVQIGSLAGGFTADLAGVVIAVVLWVVLTAIGSAIAVTARVSAVQGRWKNGPMRIELTRFRVRDGAQAKVDEWLEFLNAHRDAVRETLEPEEMYVETIFSETVDGVDYLYWYSVQGESGRPLSESEHWLDEHHVAYWRECIDDTYPGEDLTPRVHMMPQRVEDAMVPLSEGSC